MKKMLANVLAVTVLLGVSACALFAMETKVFSHHSPEATVVAGDDTVDLNDWQFTGYYRHRHPVTTTIVYRYPVPTCLPPPPPPCYVPKTPYCVYPCW
jgi:hypothetical protein